MPNQRNTINNKVPNGTAPEEPAMIKNRFSRNTMANITVGRIVAVRNANFLFSVPPKDACTRLAIYPLTPPKNVQQTIITVAMEPRFDGDRNPNNANTNVTPVMAHS